MTDPINTDNNIVQDTIKVRINNLDIVIPFWYNKKNMVPNVKSSTKNLFLHQIWKAFVQDKLMIAIPNKEQRTIEESTKDAILPYRPTL